MSKRQADKELNHDNWQDEDCEPEERGQFKQADKDEINRRVIKTAKRSLPKSPAASPFAAFGFGTASSAKPPGTTPPPPPPPPLPNGSALTAPQETKSKESDPVFLGKIKSLNECLLSWVKKHVESNPCCDLRPVFRDYERHMTEIKATASSSKPAVTTAPATVPTFNFTPSVPSSNFNFTLASSAPKATETPTSSFASASSASKPDTFKFSIAEPRNSAFTSQRSEGSPFGAAQNTQGSMFGSASLSSAPKPAFSFGLSAVAPAPTPKKDPNDSDDENYVPPKEEIEHVKEDDAVYEKRCKLFQKKGDNYVDKGIGMLYIKPHQDKYQLLVRADTRLGNILLNIMLASTLPVSRLGKNNVALVCIPNPPAPNGAKDDEVGPTTMLLRVRTAEDADDLKENLERYKSPKDSSSS